jgi:hypothetical protein
MEPLIEIMSEKEFRDVYSIVTTLQTSKKNSFQIYLMTSESLKEYEFYANEIVTYVQRWFKLFMNTIVLDFIRDERGIIYFLGVKAFTPADNFMDALKVNGNLTKKYIKDENNLKRLYKTWECRLCRISYPKDKIDKIVTFKLLLNLTKNLEKRNENIYKHISVKLNNL